MVHGTVVRHWSRNAGFTCAEHGGRRKPNPVVVITGAAEGLQVQSMVTDLGLSARILVWTDSNSAEAIASRRGLGKTRLFRVVTPVAAGG